MAEPLPLPARTRVAIGVVIALQTVAVATGALVGSDRDAPEWSVWLQGLAGIAVFLAPFMLKEMIERARQARAAARGLSRPAWAVLALFAVETAVLIWILAVAIRGALRTGC